MKVYLDCCAYNRPFDDKLQMTIRIKNEKFDYTEWQRDLWKGKTIEEIHTAAANLYNQKHG